MKGSIFQVIVLGIFVVATVLGVIIFATGGGLGGGSDEAGEVLIWGTMPETEMQNLIGELAADREAVFRSVTYVEKDPATYERDLVNALAAGKGPDLFFLPQNLILRFSDKTETIPLRTLSEGDFKATFLEEGELFLTEEGALALPFYVDPLVMFWNRDLLSGAGIGQAPRYWDEVVNVAERVSTTDGSGTITVSGVALGEARNIAHGKDILATLLLQTGNPIIRRGQSGLEVTLGKRVAEGAIPESEAALRTFTEFSDPAKPTYSWNRGLPEAQRMFTNGDLGLYFGYASELATIRARNPNLNFDMALLPQIRDGRLTATFGRLMGLGIARGSDNPEGARAVAVELASRPANEFVVSEIGFAPVRRDYLSERQERATLQTLFTSALNARGWFDPDPDSTTQVFARMVESVTSGRLRLSEAVNTAAADLNALLIE